MPSLRLATSTFPKQQFHMVQRPAGRNNTLSCVANNWGSDSPRRQSMGMPCHSTCILYTQIIRSSSSRQLMVEQSDSGSLTNWEVGV